METSPQSIGQKSQELMCSQEDSHVKTQALPMEALAVLHRLQKVKLVFKEPEVQFQQRFYPDFPATVKDELKESYENGENGADRKL